MYERYNTDTNIKTFNVSFRDEAALNRALACIEAYIANDLAKAKEVASTLTTVLNKTDKVSSYVNATRALVEILSDDALTVNALADAFDAYEAALANGDDFYHSQGSLLYADFLFPTNIFTDKNLQQVINAGALDLSKTSTDQEMLAYISSFEVQYIVDNIDSTLVVGLDKDALIAIINGKQSTDDAALLEAIETLRAAYKANKDHARSYFKKLWGEDYAEYAELNELEDVLNGIYHGRREKSANDQFILDFIAQHGNNWTAELIELWGDDFEENYMNVYKVEEVINGIYHGESLDYTDDLLEYVDKMIKTEYDEDNNPLNAELNGCVMVDERLAELLQILMDKFTFDGVDHSWTKLCYYYLYIGA